MEGRADWRENFVLKQKRIRVDRRSLTNGKPEADGSLILAPLNSGALIRQRLLSVKYLFGEADLVDNFLLLEGGKKFLNNRSIHVQFSKLI